MFCMVKTARTVPRTGFALRVQRTTNVLSIKPPLFGEMESATRSLPFRTTVETGPGPTAAVETSGTTQATHTSASEMRMAVTRRTIDVRCTQIRAQVEPSLLRRRSGAAAQQKTRYVTVRMPFIPAAA